MRRLTGPEDGQAGVEYAVLAATISIAAVALMETLGVEVVGLFSRVLVAFSSQLVP
jgi:Flp pilus assembly pilin Flp